MRILLLLACYTAFYCGWAETNICAKHGTSFSEEILKILPPHTIWELEVTGRRTDETKGSEFNLYTSIFTHISNEELCARVTRGR